jgi:5-methylcytosine-specific restriction enzyme subunit McrC
MWKNSRTKEGMTMINAFEHSRIKKDKLPTAWKSSGVLEGLERFLQDNWNQRSIFYSDGQVTSRQQFIDFDRKDGIKLQNYIGTVVFKGEQLNIFPKVYKSDEDDHDTKDLELSSLINNLVIWLGYCDKLNFPFVSMKGELTDTENLLELFVTIYVHYVKASIARHRYHRYENTPESGSFVKGKINFLNYAQKKYPTGQYHNLEYTYSNFVFDNALNQIIKCTCSLLLNLTKQPGNIRILRNILMQLGDVTVVNCMPYDCDQIHLSALHKDYRIILSMSKMFLFNKVNSYNMGMTDTFCFLFPAEVLYEGFIGGYLSEILTGRAKVTTQAGDQYLADLVVDGEYIGRAFSLREDILVETEEKLFVLDTKYKEIDRFEKIKENKRLGISDNDMKQMAVYAAKRGAQKLYLLYPLHSCEAPETIEVRYDIRLDESGISRKIPMEILKVPFIFNENPEETRAILSSILLKIIS